MPLLTRIPRAWRNLVHRRRGAVVLVVLLATTLLASWRPARHAMLVNPVLLLKEE